MGGFLDNGRSAETEGDKRLKSNVLMEVINTKLTTMGHEVINSLEGNVAVCNVVKYPGDYPNNPFDIPREDFFLVLG